MASKKKHSPNAQAHVARANTNKTTAEDITSVT